MKKIGGRFALALLFAFLPGTGEGQSVKGACKEQVLSICDNPAAQGTTLCRLVTQREPETQDSIWKFLASLGALEEETRRSLICARLLGQKTVVNLQAWIPRNVDKKQYLDYVFEAGRGTRHPSQWYLPLKEDGYVQLRSLHERLEKLNWPVSRAITMTVSGLVDEVSVTFEGKDLAKYIVVMKDVAASDIVTSHAEGGFERQVEALNLYLAQVYDEYMETGLDANSKREHKFFMRGRVKPRWAAGETWTLDGCKDRNFTYVLRDNTQKVLAQGVVRADPLGYFEVIAPLGGEITTFLVAVHLHGSCGQGEYVFQREKSREVLVELEEQ